MELSEIKKIFHNELDMLYPKEEVDHFFFRLIEHHLGLERFVLALNPSIVISKLEEQPLFEGLSELKQEKPIQHILGLEYFMDLPFKVNEKVLIPRPETEELARWIIADNNDTGENLSILDIGTGSGCIAISLGKFLTGAEVTALDISKEALELASLNAENLDVSVKFVEHDISEPNTLDIKYNIIVSNPPYVRISEKEQMRNNVKLFEPQQALFVSDEDPLIFYKHIATFAAESLVEGGLLYLEINQYLGRETRKLLEAHNFSEIEVRKDMFGNKRMIKAIWHSKS